MSGTTETVERPELLPLTPELLPLTPEKIPRALQDQPRWAPWVAIWKEKKGKYDKVPAWGLSTARPATWLTYDAALQAYQADGAKFAGIGYVMTGPHGLVGIDLDRCVEGNTIAPWAQKIVDDLSSYTELSPSRTGLRIVVEGQTTSDWTNHDIGIEVYAGHTARFLTITGKRLIQSVNEVRAAPAGVLADLAARYAKVRETAPVAGQEMPDLIDELALPDLVDAGVGHKTREFLTDGVAEGDRSRALFAAAVDLFKADLTEAVVLSVLAASPAAFEIALDHRHQDHDRAMTYLWKEHCYKAKARASASVATLEDFDGFAPLTDVQAAEGAVAAIRNAKKSAPPTLGQILERIEVNDLEGLEPLELVRLTLDDLVLAKLGDVGQETALKALKEATGLTVKALRADLAQARRKGPSGHAVVDTEWPVPTAAALVHQRYTAGSQQTLRRWQEEFLAWDGCRYQVVGTEEIRAQIYSLFAAHQVQVQSRGPVDNTLDALRALVNVPNQVTMPSWLGDAPPAPMHELVALRNGLLHLPTGELLAHDPRYFATGAVAVDFLPAAAPPAQWLKFMADAFPDDQESIDALQEWFGYLLTTDTTQQKGLICVGPKRSGKGTIARVLQALLGDHNVAGPTLGQLGRQFGMQGLIGKLLAVVSDARVSGAADLQGISETLLRVTGEDAVNVERKGTTDWVGKLPTRFVLMTNVLPGIVDGGGAVASRFIVLRFTQSFYGREDTALTGKLMTELSGILNWALDGLATLRKRGAFTQPVSGQEAVQELVRRTTPILGFIEDELIYDAVDWTLKGAIYQRYRQWCAVNGQKHVLADPAFFAELYANTDGKLAPYAPRVGGKPVKAVRGARLAEFDFVETPTEGRIAGNA